MMLCTVQEVRVDMGNNSAEFGSLGQVTVVSKSGTNGLHGAGFDYYSTPSFQSRNPFATSSSGNIVHDPGFTIGGPMYLPEVYNGKNWTFFLFGRGCARRPGEGCDQPDRAARGLARGRLLA